MAKRKPTVRRRKHRPLIHREHPNHPGWKIADTLTKALSVTAVFTVCAYVFANNFDTNEIQMLASGGGAVAAFSAIAKFWNS